MCARSRSLRLVQRVPGVHRAFAGKPDAEYDFWVPMMSVPSCVGTELSSIPAQIPYLFADNAKVEVWRKKLQTSGKTKRKVGLVWAGSPVFGNDRYRSMALADLRYAGRRREGELVSAAKRVRRTHNWPTH